MFVRLIDKREREGETRDSNIAEEHVELRKVKGHDTQQQGRGQQRRNKYFVTGEYPQAQHHLCRAEGVQEHQVGRVAPHKRGEIAYPRVRVAKYGGERRVQEGQRRPHPEQKVCGACVAGNHSVTITSPKLLALLWLWC